jgi:hypothetical protein
MTDPNKRASGKGELALLFQIASARLALPEHGRWTSASRSL